MQEAQLRLFQFFFLVETLDVIFEFWDSDFSRIHFWISNLKLMLLRML